MKLFDKTIEGVIKYINESVFAEKYSKDKKGFLQNIDPRIKVIVILSFVIITVFMKNLETILIMYLFSLILAYLSKIPLLHYIKRVWLFVPIFTGIIALPVLFTTPGKPLLVLLNHPYIAITDAGLNYAVVFTMRVATAVSYAILLTIVTPWNDIIKSLNELGVPDVIITIMNIAYRYIFLLLNTLLESMYSRKSRTCKKLGMKESWIEAGKNMGAMFIKTHQMGEDVYFAMCSRGYMNEIKSYSTYKINVKDILFFIIMLIIGISLLSIDRFII